jgi:hypothetical protein
MRRAKMVAQQQQQQQQPKQHNKINKSSIRVLPENPCPITR